MPYLLLLLFVVVIQEVHILLGMPGMHNVVVVIIGIVKRFQALGILLRFQILDQLPCITLFTFLGKVRLLLEHGRSGFPHFHLRQFRAIARHINVFVGLLDDKFTNHAGHLPLPADIVLSHGLTGFLGLRYE